MKNLLNLINESSGTVRYKVNRFPDGQVDVDIDLSSIDFKSHLSIECRITNPEELFLLRSVGSVLSDNHIRIDSIYIRYLMSSRTDRKFSPGRPHTLEMVISDICSIHPVSIYVYEPHSEETKYLIESYGVKYMDNYSHPGIYNEIYYEIHELSKSPLLVFPDEGALHRYGLKFMDNDLVSLKKVRESDGSIKLSVNNTTTKNLYNRLVVVIDDLSDGGGTFVSASDYIKSSFTPDKMILVVHHNIQISGLMKLSKCYDDIYITDSYKDWSTNTLPSNIHVIDLDLSC